MRAVQYHRFGGPEVLRLDEVPLPEPGPGQVRVAVHTAGVNPLDRKIREGLLGDRSLPRRPGSELAGIVDAPGPDAPANVGDPVVGWAMTGAYAEFALAEVVATIPPGLSWHEAASLPVAAEAAVRGLRELAIRPGETLLVQGASGVVGALATQLAVGRGVQVIGTAGDANVGYVASLGATPVAHGEGLVDRVRTRVPHVDAVLDAAGSGALRDLLTLRGGTERVVTLADPTGPAQGVRFSSRTPSPRDSETLAALAAGVAAGRLHIRHARSHPLERAAQAQEETAGGHSRGKITIDVR
jgi:NADPH:quinone reductase-like Zn-dependent oxidoreductase